MKAIQMHGYGGVEQLRYEEVPTPIPGPNEVLVKLAATSINPIDWKIRRGDRKATMPPQFPVLLGRDVAGDRQPAAAVTFGPHHVDVLSGQVDMSGQQTAGLAGPEPARVHQQEERHGLPPPRR